MSDLGDVSAEIEKFALVVCSKESVCCIEYEILLSRIAAE